MDASFEQDDRLGRVLLPRFLESPRPPSNPPPPPRSSSTLEVKPIYRALPSRTESSGAFIHEWKRLLVEPGRIDSELKALALAERLGVADRIEARGLHGVVFEIVSILAARRRSTEDAAGALIRALDSPLPSPRRRPNGDAPDSGLAPRISVERLPRRPDAYPSLEMFRRDVVSFLSGPDRADRPTRAHELAMRLDLEVDGDDARSINAEIVDALLARHSPTEAVKRLVGALT